MHLPQWQLTILFFVGVIGIILEFVIPSEIRPIAVATDLVLIGLLPVDILVTRVRNGSK